MLTDRMGVYVLGRENVKERADYRVLSGHQVMIGQFRIYWGVPDVATLMMLLFLSS